MAGTLADLTVKIGVDTKGLETGMTKARGIIQQHSKKIGMAMTAMGGVIVGGLGLAVKSAASFESAMREVNSMMSLGKDEFSAFSKQVLELSSDLGIDAVDAANAMYQAISAGIPKENAIEFLTIASKAAIAGVTDTKTAVDGLTTVINAFKIPLSETQKVADIMFTTVKGGKTTFEELSASLFNVAPIAAASGVKFEEVAAALATMTKQGVPTKIATTQLRQAMVTLQKPTKEMEDALRELGFESGQAILEELGLAGALETLRVSTGGSNEMLMKMFGSVEAGQAVLSLTGDNAKTFADDLDKARRATEGAGAATEAFNIINEGAGRQFAQMKAKIEGIVITLGEQLIPILKSVVEKVSGVIEKIVEWIKEHPELTRVVVLVAGAIGGLLLVLGPLLIFLPALTAALPLLGTAFAVLTGPVGLIIAAIAGLIAIGILVWKNWDTIKEKAVEIWEGIVSFFKGVWEKIKKIFTENWAKILAIIFPPIGLPVLIAKNWGKIKDAVAEIWEAVVRTVREWFLKIAQTLADFNPWTWLKERWNQLVDWVGEIWARVKQVAVDWWNNLTSWLSNLNPWEWVKKGWDNLVSGIKGIWDSLWKNSVIPEAIEGIRKLLAGTNLEAEAAQMFSGITKQAKEGMSATQMIIKAALEAIQAQINATPLTIPTPTTAPGVPPPSPPPSPTTGGGGEGGGEGGGGVGNWRDIQKWIDFLLSLVQAQAGGTYEGEKFDPLYLKKIQNYIAVLQDYLAAGYTQFQHQGQSLLAPIEDVMSKGGIATRPLITMVGKKGKEAIIPLDRLGGGFGKYINITLTGNTFLGNEAEGRRWAKTLLKYLREETRGLYGEPSF